MTIKEAAKELSLSRQQVRLLCRQGAFPGAANSMPSNPHRGQWEIPLAGLTTYRETVTAQAQRRGRGRPSRAAQEQD